MNQTEFKYDIDLLCSRDFNKNIELYKIISINIRGELNNINKNLESKNYVIYFKFDKDIRKRENQVYFTYICTMVLKELDNDKLDSIVDAISNECVYADEAYLDAARELLNKVKNYVLRINILSTSSETDFF